MSRLELPSADIVFTYNQVQWNDVLNRKLQFNIYWILFLSFQLFIFRIWNENINTMKKIDEIDWRWVFLVAGVSSGVLLFV